MHTALPAAVILAGYFADGGSCDVNLLWCLHSYLVTATVPASTAHLICTYSLIGAGPLLVHSDCLNLLHKLAA